MRRLLYWMVCGCFALGLHEARAQDKVEAKQEVKKVELSQPASKTGAKSTGTSSLSPATVPGDVEIHFLNGSTVRMILKSEAVEISTRYGNLKVPVKELRAIEFGMHFPPGVEKEIAKAIEDLGSTEFATRDKAAKTLLQTGPFSYPALIEAGQSKELETSRRAKDLVKALQKAHPKKDLKTEADDRIITQSFTIVGRILTPELKAETEYFGDVTVTLAKLRTLKAIGAAGAEVDVVVDAAIHANADQWMDTEYHVNGRTNLLITAKGIVDLFPQGNAGQQMATPNGMNQNRMMMFGGIRRPAGGRVGPQQAGTLFAKIGESGEPFIVGERFEGAPEQEGKLYLIIGPSPWNCQCLGTYEVKIQRK